MGSKNGLVPARTHDENPSVPPDFTKRLISATMLAGSTKMIPIFEIAASKACPGRPVSDASAVTQVTDLPAASALRAPMVTSSGVMSTAVTRAPRAAAANAPLPVPQARSTSAASRTGRRRSTASITSAAMGAMRSATAS